MAVIDVSDHYKEGVMRKDARLLTGIVIGLFFFVSPTYGVAPVTGLAEVNGTKLYSETAGEGPPLVFIHSGLLSSAEWDEQFRAFAKDYHVVRYDVSGYGKSATRRLPFSHVEDLRQLLRVLNVERAIFVVCSMGGGIAADFTLEHPEMVQALVLVGPALGGWPYSPTFIQRGYQILLATVAEGPEKGADLWLNTYVIPAPDNPAARQRFRKLFVENVHGFLAPWYLARPLNPPTIQRLPEIHIPTRFLDGQQEDSEKLAGLETIATKVTGAKKIIIPGAGHLPQMEKPEEFNRIVREFLDG